MSKLAAAGLSSTVARPGARGSDRERVAGERVGPPNGLVQVGRPLRRGHAGRPEGRLEGRSGLADQDRGDRALGRDRGEARQVDALVPAAGDEHDRRLERAQRGDHRVGLGPLRIVDEAHAVDHGDRFEPVLHAAEGARRRPDRGRVEPEGEPYRDRRQRVRHVVRARDGQLGDRHDPLRGRGRRSTATTHQAEALDPVGDDPAVDDAEPAGQRHVAPVRDGARPAGGGVRGDDRVLDVEHERAVGVDQLGQPALDPAIALERPVPVEMVRGDVGVDRHGRPARQGRQLQLGQLVDDAVVGRQLEQALDDRQADVATEDDRVPFVGGEDRGGQRRGRRLALRAGHPDRRRRAQPEEEVRLRHERRDAPGCPRHARRRARGERPGDAARSSGSRA